VKEFTSAHDGALGLLSTPAAQASLERYPA
jgi:hypothetical protein